MQYAGRLCLPKVLFVKVQLLYSILPEAPLGWCKKGLTLASCHSCIKSSACSVVIYLAQSMLHADINSCMQHRHQDFLPMRNWVFRRGLWADCGRQQPDRSHTEKHLWAVLCARPPVPLDPAGNLAAHHARRVLSGTSVWCFGE